MAEHTNKRAFARQAVRLKGEASGPNGEMRTVEIRDFCPGGMLLAYGQSHNRANGQTGTGGRCTPEKDAVISIRCPLPGQTAVALSFSGKVVRIDDCSVGLAFINPDKASLRALYDYVKRLREAALKRKQSEAGQGGQAQQQTQLRAPELLQGCKQLAQERLPQLMQDYWAALKPRWFSLANDTREPENQRIFFKALNLLDSDAGMLTQTYVKLMRASLDNLSTAAAPAPKPKKVELSLSSLSLVDENEFENWLQVADIARNVEADCRTSLTNFGVRLEKLLQRTPDKADNPFWPDAYAKAFQEIFQSAGFDVQVAKSAHLLFQEQLTTHLGTLYDELNTYLAENGVLPELGYTIAKRPAQATPAPVLHLATSDTAAAAAAPAGAASSAAAQPAALADAPAAASSANAPAVPAPQEWYRIMQELQELRSQVAGQSQLMTKLQEGVAAASAEPAASYSVPELLAALSRLKLFPQPDAAVPAEAGENSMADVRSMVLAELEAQAEQGGEAKALPAREAVALDMAGNLLHSVVNDRQAPASVKPWLQQLSVPLLKLATQDDSFFSEKNHPARQIINNLARLEFYGEDDAGQNLIRSRISNMLDEVARAEDITPGLLAQMLRELGSIIRIQEQAYAGNVKDVIRQCEEEQAALSPAQITELQEQVGTASAELQTWLKRLNHLKPGDSLLFNVKTSPHQLRLVWIGKKRLRYVFVNVKGLREESVSPLQLARGLSEGDIQVLDDGGEPLLDRAQYSMLQKMHQDLVYETTHDALTGLMNRREFERQINVARQALHESDDSCVVAYLDLDQFGLINNTLGFEGADRLLGEIATLLQEVVGEHGLLARLGGDEFGIVFRHAPLDEALAIMAKVRERFQAYRFVEDKQSLGVSFSAGVVDLGQGFESHAHVLHAAESSAHMARDKGNNYVQVFRQDNDALSRQMQILKWATRIDQALDQDQLELRYQPIAALGEAGQPVHHAEILLGIRNEEGVLISPAEFVLAAEHVRRMTTVDRWVVERVFRWLGSGKGSIGPIRLFAINLSGTSINEEGFADYILQQAHTLRVPMQQVCFEITETAGISSLSEASAFILKLKQATGCQFSLDDFGSGMSSYAYLKNLPVDYLKIDGMFIKELDKNPEDLAVVRSITEIGHFMGKKIIAEYVENDDILQKLRAVGVDYAQGYVIGKPQTLSAGG